MPGVSVNDVDSQQFVVAVAKYLKRSGKIQLPKYHDYAKTASYKELSPMDPDWFYVRAAALARRLYVSGGKGVQRLAEDLGTGSRNGRIPNRHHAAATGNVRHALQALEAMGIVEAHKKGGRKISATGRRDLDRIATRLAGLSHVKKKPVPKAKKATA